MMWFLRKIIFNHWKALNFFVIKIFDFYSKYEDTCFSKVFKNFVIFFFFFCFHLKLFHSKWESDKNTYISSEYKEVLCSDCFHISKACKRFKNFVWIKENDIWIVVTFVLRIVQYLDASRYVNVNLLKMI